MPPMRINWNARYRTMQQQAVHLTEVKKKHKRPHIQLFAMKGFPMWLLAGFPDDFLQNIVKFIWCLPVCLTYLSDSTLRNHPKPYASQQNLTSKQNIAACCCKVTACAFIREKCAWYSRILALCVDCLSPLEQLLQVCSLVLNVNIPCNVWPGSYQFHYLPLKKQIWNRKQEDKNNPV